MLDKYHTDLALPAAPALVRAVAPAQLRRIINDRNNALFNRRLF